MDKSILSKALNWKKKNDKPFINFFFENPIYFNNLNQNFNWKNIN
jgi:hypothetical protein